MAGMVKIQAWNMPLATIHLTDLNLLAEPTPKIVEPITWVVLKGKPNLEAASIIVAAEVSAAKPWIGVSWVNLVPMVWIILQPPKAVPKAIANADKAITQTGTAKGWEGILSPDTRLFSGNPHTGNEKHDRPPIFARASLTGLKRAYKPGVQVEVLKGPEWKIDTTAARRDVQKLADKIISQSL